MSRYALPLLFFFLPPLSAQTPMGLGAKASTVFPIHPSDEATSRPGFQVGLFGLWKVTDTWTLRPRLEFTRYADRSWTWQGPLGSPEVNTRIEYETRNTQTALGLDALYHFHPDGHGVYLAAGLAVHGWRRTDRGVQSLVSTPGQTPQSLDKSKTWTRLGLNVGVGYQFNRTWGTELGLQVDGGEKVLTPFTTLQLSMSYRFK